MKIEPIVTTFLGIDEAHAAGIAQVRELQWHQRATATQLSSHDIAGIRTGAGPVVDRFGSDRGREDQVVIATLAVENSLLDGRQRDRDRASAGHRRFVVGGRQEADRVRSGGAMKDHRVTGGGIATVDRDSAQAGGRRRMVQRDRIDARTGVDGQVRLIDELDRLEIVDRHAARIGTENLACFIADLVVILQQAGQTGNALDRKRRGVDDRGDRFQAPRTKPSDFPTHR